MSRAFTILIESRWHTFFAPPWVPFIPADKADHIGWCGFDDDSRRCPLSAYPHVMCPIAGRPHALEKYCTVPFIRAGLIPLSRYMRYGGCGAKSDDYIRAKALYHTRILIQGTLWG